MSKPDAPSAVERYTAIVSGAVLLLIPTSLFGWGVRLGVAGLLAPAGWPPGLEKLLVPIAITAIVVGFGAWRLLRMGLPQRIGGVSVGWAVVAAFGIAGGIGALL